MLREHSAGVMTLYDFSTEWKKVTATDKKGKRGYSLSVSNSYYGFPQSAARAFDLYFWKEGYKRHKIKDTTAAVTVAPYLEAITKTERPIVFFVPTEVYSNPYGAQITRREYEWFVKNVAAQKARNTYFVFGLHSMMDQETHLEMIPLQTNPLSKTMHDIFNNPSKYLPSSDTQSMS
jgi:hypothetical protein